MSMMFSGWNIGSLKIKNRIVMPPMVMYKSSDGMANDFHFVHYAARAIGGVGLIIVEATAVEDRGRITDNDLGIWDDRHIEGHARINELCHRFGAKTALQIAHAGRKSIVSDSQPIAPSSIIFANDGVFKVPHEMEWGDIQTARQSFVKAAMRAKEAGYDAVEIHAAHGYLIYEFLSPLTNQRTDEYGGSFDNRCLFLMEILRDIKKYAPELPVIVRISADEWVDGGWNINDTVELSKRLQNAGVNAIHVSAGGNHLQQPNMPKLLPMYQCNYAKAVKDAVDIPVIAVGLITTEQEGEKLILDGTCDAVAYGRELLRNPNFPHYAAKTFGEVSNIDPSYLRAF